MLGDSCVFVMSASISNPSSIFLYVTKITHIGSPSWTWAVSILHFGMSQAPFLDWVVICVISSQEISSRATKSRTQNIMLVIIFAALKIPLLATFLWGNHIKVSECLPTPNPNILPCWPVVGIYIGCYLGKGESRLLWWELSYSGSYGNKNEKLKVSSLRCPFNK